MACNRVAFFFFISSLLLLQMALPSAVATLPETMAEVVVEGMVYCQACDSNGNWSLANAEPIPFATVSVICKNHMDQVSFYKAYQTDQNGYFYAPLHGFKMSHPFLDHPLHGCHVKLVSSPLETCTRLSNLNYGMYGCPLHYENKRLRGRNYQAVVYGAGPLAFLSAECPSTPQE